MRGDPASVMACILAGEELGLKPMQSLRMVHVVDGRPSASAELMRALVNRAGHRLSVVEAKQDRVTLHGQRRDTGAQATVTWTIADAQRAKLTGNPSWAKYPRSMLLARATSELCRQIFADVVGGLYTPEETASIEGHVHDEDPYDLVDPIARREIDPVTGEIDDDTPAHVIAAEILDAEDAMDAMDAEWLAEARGDDQAAALADQLDLLEDDDAAG
jgi:hypothetical protein